MDSQHPFQSYRWASRTLRFRIERFNDLAHLTPGNEPVHLVEKSLSSRRLAIPFKAFFGNRLLAHETCSPTD